MYQTTLVSDLKIVDLMKFIDLVSGGREVNPTLRDELYTEIRTSTHGNQIFTNDSIFIYNVSDEMMYEIEEEGKPFSAFGIEGLIAEKAKELELFNEHSDSHIIFNVCW